MFSLVKMRRSARSCNDLTAVTQAFYTGQVMTLALNDKPYPYAVPVNYAPLELDNELYLIFHGAQAGRRYTLLQQQPQVGFSIILDDKLGLKDSACASTCFYRSLCGDGIVHRFEGERALLALQTLMTHLGSTIDKERMQAQLRQGMRQVNCCALQVVHAGLKSNPACVSH